MSRNAYPVISIEEAWQRIAAAVRPLPPVVLPLTEVLGHVLTEDVVATENMPPFRASAMDGYAVLAEDAFTERRIIGEQDAGRQKPLRVEPGTAVRIMTGAPLPEGADAVIRVEDAVEQEGWVRFLVPVSRGDNVRPVGQDVAAGDIVLEKGLTLGPAEIGLLATIGHTRVLVHPMPRVAVMATGDELVPPERALAPGEIRDSNSYAVAAAVEAALRAAILEGVSRADMLLSTGGVSMGVRDLIKPLLAELGTVHFGQVAVRPGKPLTFATVGDVPVFGLPGFPVSSLVSFEMFVRPALRIMSGQHKLWRPEVPACLSRSIRHSPDRTEFQRAIVVLRDGEYWAETTGVQVSGRLKSLVGANALLKLPAGVTDFKHGDAVTAILINQAEVS